MKEIINFKFIQKTVYFILIICITNSLSAQGWSFIFSGSGGFNGDTLRNDVIHIPTFEEGKTYPVGLYYEEFRPIYQFTRVIDERYDGSGSGVSPTGNDPLFEHLPKSSVLINGDTTIVLEDRIERATGEQKVYITRFYVDPASGSAHPFYFDWHNEVLASPNFTTTGHAIQKTSDQQFIVLGTIANESFQSELINDLFIAKIDAFGNTVWTQNYSSLGNDIGIQILEANDGGFWILKNNQEDPALSMITLHLIKTDPLGNIEWETSIGNNNDLAKDMLLSSDGQLVITGQNVNQQLFVLKIDELGGEVWRRDYALPEQETIGNGIIEDGAQDIVIAGVTYLTTIEDEDALLVKLSPHGAPLWERTFGKQDSKSGYNDIALMPSGQYLMGGFRQVDQQENKYHGYLAKSDTFGIIKSFLVKGNVYHDLDLDCSYSPDELHLANWKVEVANDTLFYFANTDEHGNYAIPISAPAGSTTDYIVSVYPPNDYWLPCTNDVPIVATYGDTIQIDFPIQSTTNCPYLDLQIGNTNIRPCETATLYFDFCNLGTIPAEDAMIEVNLHEYLTFNSATLNPSLIDGQRYTFSLGDVAINECGAFSMEVDVACDSIALGDVLCMDIHISPDTLCQGSSTLWSGALIEAGYDCEDGEVKFHLENIGAAPMQDALEYIIIEDAVLLIQDDFNLNPTEKLLPDALPINGSVYHLIAQQEPGAPGATLLSIGADACPNENDPILNQFAQNSGDPYTITYCPIVVGSYDPNDKQAVPAGFGADNFLLPNTDLDYTIRFQNTGTDTAFRVVIRDTLSAYLDPATIIPGASSHPYNWRLYGEGVLEFNFYNIALPDSTTNLAASQGFVKFRIQQRRDLSEGTVIENRAGIYFDFNPPIITNTAFHTITNLIDIVNGSISVENEAVNVSVFPNPMQEGAWIQLQNGNYLAPELRLFDASGKQVRLVNGTDNQLWLDRADLPEGMYFFTIYEGAAWVASGKIVVGAGF